MIKAVLLDLDNTLLCNPNVPFTVEYLRAVDAFFEAQWQFGGMSRILMQAVSLTKGARDGQKPNEAIFLDLIVAETGHPVESVQAAFDTFYSTVYPDLQRCTEPIDKVRDLIHYLRELNYTLIVATNPLYPKTAIRQRMAWAQMPDDDNTYALITTAENMHFCKPDPAYYAEILARVGVEPDEALMVGDDMANDIVPAAAVGLSTFHVTEGNSADGADGSGSLLQFYEAVKAGNWLEHLSPRPLVPDMIELQYRGNIGALFGMVSSLPEHFWRQHPDPDEWSPLEIVCHLRDSERSTQRPRLQRILAEDNPFLTPPKTPPGPHIMQCANDGMEVAQQFAGERWSTIEWLRRLNPGDWQKPARHSIFGPTSLIEMALFTAQHDRLHLNQLCQTIGNCE